MRGVFLFFVLFFVGCTRYVDAPKHKLSKDEMATIIAELSLNEKLFIVNPNGSVQEGVFHILKKHGITDEDFKENYTYYLSQKEMDNILERAQEKIIEMNPKAEEHIKKEEKMTPPLEGELNP